MPKILTRTSKMPGPSWSLSAFKTCETGMKLAKIPGSVCERCYATRNFYLMDNVKQAQDYRLKHYEENPEAWVEYMIREVGQHKYFRWFDSGSPTSVEMLHNIMRVVKATPNTKHWLPIREYSILDTYTSKYGPIPTTSNIVVRVSHPMKNKLYPTGERKGLPTSGVFSVGWLDTLLPGMLDSVCPAPQQDNKCGDCRKCWDPQQKVVIYQEH